MQQVDLKICNTKLVVWLKMFLLLTRGKGWKNSLRQDNGVLEKFTLPSSTRINIIDYLMHKILADILTLYSMMLPYFKFQA